MTKEYEQVHMTQTAKEVLAEVKAINEAIKEYFVSPTLLREVLRFAEEQDLRFTGFVPSSGLFFLSDGEGYSAKAVLEYFEVDTSRLVLPTAVDDPINAGIDVYCINCGEDEDFAYIGTKANGDIWRCRTCSEEFEHTQKGDN